MRVLLTQQIPRIAIDTLRQHDIEVDVLSVKKPTKQKIISALKKTSYDGMLCLLTDRIDKEVIDSVGSQMTVIANYAVGFENIDIAYAKEKGIVVTNTPGVLSETVAEHTIALIFAVARRIVEADSFTRKGKFKGWEPELFLGRDLFGRTLGIIGAGRIGSRVAVLAKGIGMDILYCDIARNEKLEKSTGARMCDSPEHLLRESDVVSLHLPSNKQTFHYINAVRLRLMKKHSILVNASRGAVVDEEALTKALENNEIFGAGLDVFEREPSISRLLRSLPNVVLTPHIASASFDTRSKMAKIAAQNVVAVLFGGTAPNAVV